ncbi:lipoprotein-releasing system ATP-binding protein [Methanosarcina thermophila]|jgi:lipoprotein-releasing system ATP-binding protein|uniref:Lipoprotein releasing system, ATP-binding protein n=3 Tax=Methanosarcina thermophila TaxID=2210 RepID=A0A1I6ZY11_METTE|nr:ABC transporter ATP-binding protein [Methanosarcina thermophila]ALK06116.1 MAG: ABC transporter ATP-binding protein [Methanosarcina sp. 795]AKB12277.1 Lipoprotein releasing system ATP-binding protein LolD [Methanosarcina thermophila TM-1]AKB14519.1 Lipoprotein releasing system ATP-binding protein LolD [Methanosarcina thermophila CHTI-55]NLU56464.1 ABC transporter ATP-binding protein [Methanosarcina thermophila]SFT67541.1 lipoprotein-releasing system ATP-binding protein [Methanosarcina therm
MTEESPIIELKNLTKIYKNGMEFRALDNANLKIKKGEFVAIVGPSGSGKSTLMHLIGLLDTPSFGTLLIDGKDVTKMSDKERSEMRNRMLGFVFQYHHLLPDFTALENVAMPLLIAGKSRKEAKEIAEKLLKEVGLEDRMNHKPSELSGGQNQRVAVARALSCSPAIVLGDEPTGNLDTKTGNLIYDLLRRLNRQYNQTFIVVTHNEDLASKADRIIRLVDGKITDQ